MPADREGWVSVRDDHHQACGQIGFRKELTGPTALFSPAVINPCIAENMTFLCDIMTPNSSIYISTGGMTSVCF